MMAVRSLQPLETDRLVLRPLTEDDAAFILRLLNDPSFLTWIGDKGVRTLDEARHYIRTNPVESYRANGFGLCLTLRKPDRMAMSAFRVKRTFR